MEQFRPRGFEVLPPVVKNIIIINVLVFIATIVVGSTGSHPIDLGKYLALYQVNSPMFRPWQLLTHMFMHGNVGVPDASYEEGFMHLFGNMFALWMFGSVLENVWGGKKFLIFYLLCGLGAAFLHLGVLHYEHSILVNAVTDFRNNPTWAQYNIFVKGNIPSDVGTQFFQLRDAWSENPNQTEYANNAQSLINSYVSQSTNEGTVGASGAVFGILFAFGYLFPNTLLYFYFFFPIKAKYFIALYAAWELFNGFRHSAGDNVAHFAHLGGMLIAFIILKFWFQKTKNTFY